ncbi:U-box domain-containing protein 44 [Physcomitrium patens]|uniref:RING-type E3 ubiquitin transferase n=1 Tax=Physcomitrium patens TaxID=3218 RepID=A0A2K1J121_PHYPA|nr:U-box domain-containing protein 44-like [Physcomitrium patens]XP_024402640.1 U-box domain-containing protein 44-like [Physcomitrium patens]PNR35216.1 hypothetical protein PHYPA_023115 [Physcomitrium patens]|eukprot:XP_024402639.1 U-box domain-containing protein 44-like [Physcomitrella patens]
MDAIKRDVQETKEPHDPHMMGVVENSSNSLAQQSSDQATPSEDPDGMLHHREYRQLEPLYEAFICPLTRKIMRDPVSLENGVTYEKSAIDRWMQECRNSGKEPTCFVTGNLITAPPKPSIALRNTIEEWTTRNEQSRIGIAKKLITVEASENDVLCALTDLQVLCRKKANRYRIRKVELIPQIVDRLKNGEVVRILALAMLRILAEDDEDAIVAIGQTDALRLAVKCLARDGPEEREESVKLLHELSKSYFMCEKIGATNGAILFLVGMTSGSPENMVAGDIAEEVLSNLSKCDKNILQMAENGRLQPLLDRLTLGDAEVRVEMAEVLSDLTLTPEGKARAGELVSRTLVEMLNSSSSSSEKAAALKALRSISTLETNGSKLLEAGVLIPLMRDLFVVGPNMVPMKLKEVAATILANVVNASGMWESMPVDDGGDTLTSEATIHRFLHLISNTGPKIEAKLLLVVAGLASKPRAVSRVVSAIKSSGAIVALIQFLEAPQPDLRVVSIRLLYLLSFHMSQELADGLRVTTRQLSTLVKLVGQSGVTEEQSFAAGLLANLTSQDKHLTRALLDENALPTIVERINEVRRGVVNIGGARHIAAFQKGLVGILLQFTYELDDPVFVDAAQANDLTSLFTALLQTSTLDEVQRSSALALENLSVKSPQLSIVPEPPAPVPVCPLFPCLFQKTPPLRVALCELHGGVCSMKTTFCLLQAEAIGPLLACLDHRNTSLVEAAMGALSTVLMDTVDVDKGVMVLYHADAIHLILMVMQEHRTEVLRQRAVWMVERILRNVGMAQAVSIDSNVHTSLVDAFRHGNSHARQSAENALKTLNRIPQNSVANAPMIRRR